MSNELSISAAIALSDYLTISVSVLASRHRFSSTHEKNCEKVKKIQTQRG